MASPLIFQRVGVVSTTILARSLILLPSVLRYRFQERTDLMQQFQLSWCYRVQSWLGAAVLLYWMTFVPGFFDSPQMSRFSPVLKLWIWQLFEAPVFTSSHLWLNLLLYQYWIISSHSLSEAPGTSITLFQALAFMISTVRLSIRLSQTCQKRNICFSSFWSKSTHLSIPQKETAFDWFFDSLNQQYSQNPSQGAFSTLNIWFLPQTPLFRQMMPPDSSNTKPESALANSQSLPLFILSRYHNWGTSWGLMAAPLTFEPECCWTLSIRRAASLLLQMIWRRVPLGKRLFCSMLLSIISNFLGVIVSMIPSIIRKRVAW